MGKRIENAKKLIDESKNYTLDEAISFFLKDYSEKHSAKFDETIEFIMKLRNSPMRLCIPCLRPPGASAGIEYHRIVARAWYERGISLLCQC